MIEQLNKWPIVILCLRILSHNNCELLACHVISEFEIASVFFARGRGGGCFILIYTIRIHLARFIESAFNGKLLGHCYTVIH